MYYHKQICNTHLQHTTAQNMPIVCYKFRRRKSTFTILLIFFIVLEKLASSESSKSYIWRASSEISSSSDPSYSDIEEDGLNKDEFVDDTGKSITADQVCDSLAMVLKKHQEKLNQDLEDMAQRGSFEEEGVFISEEESIKENDDMETE